MNDPSEAPARILIVDDQQVHRSKLLHAVHALGHEAEAVDSGAQALLRLQDTPFDLVLLDILMPDMSGFEVMDVMRRDRRIAGTPVIVVSALKSEMGSVVRAVEMGAVDVLPKHFDAVLLAARLDSVLERRSARLREQDNRHHMSRLVDAAALLEEQAAEPVPLGLESTCARDDAIGRLARVFMQMIEEARCGDARLQHQLDGLRRVALALVAGLVLGLALALAHTALGAIGSRPTDVASLGFWLAGMVALPCLGALPWMPDTRKDIAHLVLPAMRLALSAGLLGVLPLLWLLRELPVTTLVTVLPAEIVFALLLRLVVERRTPARADAAALGIGTIALAVLFLWPAPSALGWQSGTLTLALCVPVGWALAARDIRTTLAGHAAPVGTSVALTGLAAASFAIVCVPIALAGNSPPGIGVPTEFSLEILAGALLAIVIGAGSLLRILLVAQGGTVSAAASSLVAALSAVGYVSLLFGERPPLEAIVPLALFAAALAVRGIANDTRRRAIVQTLDVDLA